MRFSFPAGTYVTVTTKIPKVVVDQWVNKTIVTGFLVVDWEPGDDMWLNTTADTTGHSIVLLAKTILATEASSTIDVSRLQWSDPTH